MAADTLDHRHMADAKAKNEAITVKLIKADHATPRGKRVAGINGGDGTTNVEGRRLRQHVAGNTKGFIPPRLRIPKSTVPKFLHKLREIPDCGRTGMFVGGVPNPKASKHHGSFPFR